MKGKVAFVLGAAVGYVLGTRAGRERYAQIQRGAQKVWESDPVQRGVTFVKDAAQDRVDNVKNKAVQAGKNAFAAFVTTAPKPAPAAPAQAPAPGATAKAAPAADPAQPEPEAKEAQ